MDTWKKSLRGLSGTGAEASRAWDEEHRRTMRPTGRGKTGPGTLQGQSETDRAEARGKGTSLALQRPRRRGVREGRGVPLQMRFLANTEARKRGIFKR